MWAKYWPAIRRLFVSLPFYPIFWCLFSSLVQRRWKSNVFPARIKWHFTPMKTHLGLTDKDLMLNVQTNKQKSRYGKDFLMRVWSRFPLDVEHSCCLLIVRCEQITRNINFATFSQAIWVGTDEENTQTSANGSQTVPEGSCAEDLYFPHSPPSMFCSWRQVQHVSSCVKHAVIT